MKKKNYKEFKKGLGIIVKIPGDEHNGIQNIRPGIVINSEPKYVTAQLLSSQPSEYDFASFIINNKTQYIRAIYLKNIPLNQIKGIWQDSKQNKSIQLNTTGKIMKTIESNPYKVSSITLSLDHYLDLTNIVDLLQKENKLLRQELEQEKNKTRDIKNQTFIKEIELE